MPYEHRKLSAYLKDRQGITRSNTERHYEELQETVT